MIEIFKSFLRFFNISMDLSIEINKPIGFGVLTCENIDQAIIRSDPSQGNKGSEAARACVDLLNLK